MLTINTNISSLIVQSSLQKSTFGLNQAIERMTTGFKINGAKDNAAGYSIAAQMSTKISAYQVAEDNAAMGLDLLTTANDSLAFISEHLTRIRDLMMQAKNGTYGDESMKAINSEINARLDEITRLYSTAEYNGMKLFGELDSSEKFEAPEVDFISEITKRDTSAMTTLASVDENQELTSGTYSISTAEELAKLASMTNNKKIGSDCEFVLANDIDLSAYSTGEGWIPIGISSNSFKANFDGNGYVVRNLYINRPTEERQGLFGSISEPLNSKKVIKNLAVVDFDVTGRKRVGGLAGYSEQSFENCYVSGTVKGEMDVGGIVGESRHSLTNCCADAVVVASGDRVGALVGTCSISATVNGCYSSGKVSGHESVGGLVGWLRDNLYDSYSTADVIGNENVGGLCGALSNSHRLVRSFATGNVKGVDSVGGLIGVFSDSWNGSLSDSASDCYFTGNVEGDVNVGGIFGWFELGDRNTLVLKNYTSSGSIKRAGQDVDDLAGYVKGNLVWGEGCGAKSANSTVGKILDDVLFQVGINSSESSQVVLNTSFVLENVGSLRRIGLKDGNYLETIDSLLASISVKQTEYGACQNRLESALEEINTHYENLLSSRSTLRDADVAKESSAYIRNQILQQASAMLLATANQTPAIALQLL